MTSAATPDLSLSRDEQAAAWCLTLAEGQLSVDEQHGFDTWIAESANARAFEEAIAVWNATDIIAEAPEIIAIRSAALQNFRRANRTRWTSHTSRRWSRGVGIGALFAIALTTGILGLSDPVTIYETGIDERRIAMLEDGSKLSLDSDTQVEVRLRSNRRELTLVHGRAKFDVAKDPLRPFAVTAVNRLVVATGTSFSVELLSNKMHVSLYDGRVAVLDKKDDKSLLRKGTLRNLKSEGPADQVLIPGRELIASLDAPVAQVFESDPAQTLSWESGQLTVDDEPLALVVERMNRYSQEKLIVGDRAIRDIRINGVFTAGDTRAFLEGLTALNPVRAVRRNGRITLLSASEPLRS